MAANMYNWFPTRVLTGTAHLAVRLEFGEDALLRAPPFVEENDLAW